MLLVGQGKVGKTSLIKRLIDHAFNPGELKTEGIDIRNWEILVRDQPIQLNIWDFGGQEIMHATHQFFLTKRSLYVLVLDARLGEEENRIEYWLKIIHSFGDDAPVILVGNQTDEHPLDLDQAGLKKKYPNIKSILSTSCKTGAGIDALQQAIMAEIEQLNHVFDVLPGPWFDVKQKLEALDQDFMPYTDYETLCEETQLKDKISQSTLISLLHELGVVVNFREDDRLEDTNVLNPEWVTNAVYNILNNHNLIINCKGILECQTLSTILNQSRYPREKHRFIIDMMRKFELCFPFDGNDNSVLIPDLLPKEEPFTGQWNNTLAFEYHYNVLPNSIISRFIVRQHQRIHQKTYWRTGVVLSYEDNTAYIKSDREDRKIFIRISGPSATRRSFLAVIRAEFESIHRTIKGIEATQKVPLPNHPELVVDYKHLRTLERLGQTEFIPEGLEEMVVVKQLLDGVDQPLSLQPRDVPIQRQPPRPQPAPPPAVFISYQWGGASEDLADQIEAVFEQKDIQFIRDKNNLGFKGSIRAFMRRLGEGACVITIISDQYLKSQNCMFELMEIAKNLEFRDRIFPIVLEDAAIDDPEDLMDYVLYWQEKNKSLEAKMKKAESSAYLDGIRESRDLYADILQHLPKLTSILSDMNTLTRSIHEDSGFAELIKAITQKLEAI